MKWITHIFFLLLLYILCSSKSCSDDRTSGSRFEKGRIEAARDSVRHVFGTDTLSTSRLKAFEHTAEQKLVDFADYLKIASDTSVNALFRKQGAEMAGHLFIPGKVIISNWSQTDATPTRVTLQDLLEKCISVGMRTWVQPGTITILIPFIRENDSAYKGRLVFYGHNVSYSEPFQKQNASKRLSVDIYAIRKVKSFGTENLRVWEVYLGDIN